MRLAVPNLAAPNNKRVIFTHDTKPKHFLSEQKADRDRGTQ
jgi:hypothetical protein